MAFFVHLILIFLVSNNALADLNLFNAGNDAALFLDSPSEDLFSAADANLFTSLPEEDLLNGDIISSCPVDKNDQAFIRARGVVDCPNGSPPIPFTAPTLPGFNDIYNILNPKSSEQGGSSGPSGPEKNRPTGPYQYIEVPDQGELVASEPEYYCHLFVTPFNSPPPFTIPVCGSGDKAFRSSRSGFLYSWVDRSTILFPTKDWVCPESEFFCCKVFEASEVGDDAYMQGGYVVDWDEYQRLIDGDRSRMVDPGMGTGTDCRNLIEAGWNGYNSDREGAFEVVDPASLGIQDFQP